MAKAAPSSPIPGVEPDGAARPPAGPLAQDDARRSFLRMVSHELRTPLNSILGFSEILSSELYGPLGAPQYKEYAEIIRTSGARLLKLVNQVLEIARLEGGTADLDLRPESLDHALDDVLDHMKDELALRGVGVVIEGQGRLPSVQADARALRSILSNLLQNAVTFSPDHGIVRVRADATTRYVEVSIIDQGPGADPTEIPRLLRPFEQGENALTRRSEGAGLGLPIVELLCSAMGGHLRLTSAAGDGMTAKVRLPAAA